MTKPTQPRNTQAGFHLGRAQEEHLEGNDYQDEPDGKLLLV